MSFLSFSKANRLRKEARDLRNVESRKEFHEALRANAVPSDDFWYTNSFTYDIWRKRKDNTQINMNAYSHKAVYEAFDALLGGISSARSAAAYSNYVPDQMGN